MNDTHARGDPLTARFIRAVVHPAKSEFISADNDGWYPSVKIFPDVPWTLLLSRQRVEWRITCEKLALDHLREVRWELLCRLVRVFPFWTNVFFHRIVWTEWNVINDAHPQWCHNDNALINRTAPLSAQAQGPRLRFSKKRLTYLWSTKESNVIALSARKIRYAYLDRTQRDCSDSLYHIETQFVIRCTTERKLRCFVTVDLSSTWSKQNEKRCSDYNICVF